MTGRTFYGIAAVLAAIAVAIILLSTILIGDAISGAIR